MASKLHVRILLYFLWGIVCAGSKFSRRPRMESFPVAEIVGSLDVRSGMTVFLNPTNFKIRVESEYCKIVLSEDPFCTRVGNLSRTSFPCEFDTNTIFYTHSGSPIYKSDCIKFEMYIFTRGDTILQVMAIDVSIDDGQHDYSLREPALFLSGPGKEIEINAVKLLPMNLAFPWNSYQCNIQLYTSGGWPLHGVLQVADQIKKDFTANCSEFKVSYKHDGTTLPRTDFVTFNVAYKKTNKSPVRSINYYLTVKIEKALQNTPPVLLSRSTRLIVNEYSITVLRATYLQSVDFRSTPGQLLIKIQRTFLSKSTGYIAHVNHIETPVRAFYQSDINKGQIVFVAPREIERRRFLSIHFKATDPYGVRSNIIGLSIVILPKLKRHLTVLYNPGLYLLEGQSRVLSTSFLNLACSKRLCDRVKVDVWNGPQHGTLLKAGNKVRSFKYGDLKQRLVYYEHDNSETTQDSIVLVASDRGERTFFTISIRIEPKDDSAPILSIRRDIALKEGDSLVLNQSVLNAVDADSNIDEIRYEIVKLPTKGIIFKRNTTEVLPRATITAFSEADVLKGTIYYEASKKRAGADSFEFRLHDLARPPNYSETYSVDVWIDAVDTGAPSPSNEHQCRITANETSKLISLKDRLSYFDRDSVPNDIKYFIVSEPKTSHGNLKSKIIYSWPLGFLFKVNEFTQADLNYNRIYLDIGEQEIGPRKQVITFRYNVRDAVGNESPIDECIIQIFPVNNQPPSVDIRQDVKVLEGGKVCINTTHFMVLDKDTRLDEVMVSVTKLPMHGVLKFNGQNLATDNPLKASELLISCLQYIHDGNEENRDEIQITAFDGVHKSASFIAIRIEPVDDLPSVFLTQPSPSLSVKENGSVLLLPSLVRVIDEDTEESKIKIFLQKEPRLGTITLDGNPTSMFTQADIDNKRVRYEHRNADVSVNGESDIAILSTCPEFDSATKSRRDCAKNQRFNITIKIRHVDLEALNVTVNKVLNVAEGGQEVMSRKYISCNNIGDTKNLKIIIIRNATFGVLQMSAPDVGSELVVHRIIYKEFPCRAINKGQIKYLQTIHSGLEPHNDSIVFRVVDEYKQAKILELKIKILPVNDEAPKIIGTRLITMEQGTSLRILRYDLNISDLDTSMKDQRLLLQTKPKSGSILYICQSRRMVWRRLTTKVEIPFHRCAFVYKHDGSANKVDYFTVVATDGQFFASAKIKVNVYLKYGVFNLVNLQDVPVISFVPVKISSKNLLCQVQGLSSKLVKYEVLKPPLFGSLSLSPNMVGQPDVREFSQDDINNGYLFYSLKEKPRTIPFFERVNLRVFGRQFKERKISIRIMIDFPNEAHLDVRTSHFQLFQGQEKPIISTHLSTTTVNGTSNAADIRYRVIKDPVVGVLKLVLGEGSEATTTNFFSQKDINDGRLFFQVPQQYTTENQTDSFEFTVTAGNSFKVGRLLINIFHKTVHSLLTRNVMLVAKQDKFTLITPLELRVREDLEPNKVMYEVFLEPRYGSFLLDGRRATGAFTQQQINELRVGYACHDHNGTNDEAIIRVKAENKQGHMEHVIFKFSIQLQPKTSKAVKLLRFQNITAIEELGSLGLGTLISRRHLLGLTCNGTEHPDIVYVLRQAPTFGLLMNVTSGKKVENRMYQSDIDGNEVVYVNLEKTNSYQDSFQFDVKFEKCTSLKNNILFIKWSVASIKQEATQACNGQFELNILRHGFNEQVATTDVHVMTEKFGTNALQELQQFRIMFARKSASLTVKIKVSKNDVLGKSIYVRLRNGFNTAIDKEHGQIILEGDRAFRKCCANCDTRNQGKEKGNEAKDHVLTEHHILTDLQLRPYRSPGPSSQRMKSEQTLKSPNQRHVKYNHERVKRRKRQKKRKCQRGWQEHEKHCYKMFAAKKRTWRRAAKICLKKQKAMLFFPRNHEEEVWVSTIQKGNTIWLGIKKNKRGQWLWSDGTPIELDGRKLINLGSREDGRVRSFCGVLGGNGRWNIKDCRAQRYGFVCKKALS